MKVALSINGESRSADVEPRKTLLDCLRDDFGLTGSHTGCEHGVCGACTVLLDGEPARSCLLFAVQADGYQITTIEGIAPARPRDAHRPAARRRGPPAPQGDKKATTGPPPPPFFFFPPPPTPRVRED